MEARASGCCSCDDDGVEHPIVQHSIEEDLDELDSSPSHPLTLPALAAGVMACSGEKVPTQPAAPTTKLVFMVEPTNATGAQLITPAVQVAVQDTSGNTVTTAADSVTLGLEANPVAGTLTGTLTVAATQGIATFNNLRIDRPGSGYRLAVFAAGRSGAISASFTVTLTFTAVSAGDRHTCGVTAAGTAYCWGFGGASQLGDPTTDGWPSPVLVAGGVSFAGVSSGGGSDRDYTCGLTAAGAAYCWGSNLYGRLGDGTTTDRLTPSLVAGGVSLAELSAGAFHTCGFTAAGAAYCWGNNSNGELGDGTTTNRSSPVLVAGGVSFAAVSVENGHTCGLTAAGAAYCWGYNSDGQLGDGTTTDRSSPVLVAGGASFATVSAATFHTCGLTVAGAAYCWGENANGQLGDGTETQRLTPVRVVQ